MKKNFISKRMNLDENMLKCAAYYYRMCKQLPERMGKKHFPPKRRDLLKVWFEEAAEKQRDGHFGVFGFGGLLHYSDL